VEGVAGAAEGQKKGAEQESESHRTSW
jgi:hypothetical protein